MAKSQTKSPAADLVARAYNVKDAREQQALYKDWAETYDQTMIDGLQYSSPRKCAALYASYQSDKQALVLDIGCGTGLAGAELAKLGYKSIDGLDLSQDMLDVAAKRNLYGCLFTGDLLQPLEISTGAYGGAICTGTFTHAHVGAECLDEVVRILKPGAVLAFTVHRDAHEALGFSEKLTALVRDRCLEQAVHRRDTYYDNTDDLEGHYYVYLKV